MKRRDFVRKAATASVAVAILPPSFPTPAPEAYATPEMTSHYVRMAIDNKMAERLSEPGAFADFQDRIYDKLWRAWGEMEMGHTGGT